MRWGLKISRMGESPIKEKTRNLVELLIILQFCLFFSKMEENLSSTDFRCKNRIFFCEFNFLVKNREN